MSSSTPVSRSVSPSPSPTIVNDPASAPISSVSNFRKIVLLLAFSVAQFLDILNLSALFSAIPSIAENLNMTSGESVWLISAYQLTFAAFLLLSGRLSDIYNPKRLFIMGLGGLGLFSLGAGFVHNKIALIVLRAFSGIAGAITIPSALNLIVHLFPDPAEQARAIGIFGGTAALANVLGLIIGALLVQYTSWSWIFWLSPILALPIAIGCLFLIPATTTSSSSSDEPESMKAKRIDIIGVSMLTSAFILFIFALTSGSTDGWKSAVVLAPLIISIILIVAFFFYETRVPEDSAALPPRLWFYPNFSVLFGVALLPFLWWTTSFLLFTSLWQEVYHWSPVMSGVRFLPLGVLAFIVMMFSGYLQTHFKLKSILLTGSLLLIPSTILLPFAGSPDRYWSIVFPAFVIGTIGATLLFSNTNIAMFRNTPPSMAGTVGAIFNAALQIGSAIGVAAITSIETNIEAKSTEGPANYSGKAAGFWFLLGLVVLETVGLMVFFKDGNDLAKKTTTETDQKLGASLEKVDTTETLSGDPPSLKKEVESA